MTFSFNILTEPCFQVVGLDNRRYEVSLRDLILRAHKFKEIFDSSPLVKVGILRLSLALLYRVVASHGQPLKQKDWLTVWQKGKFSEEALDRYLVPYQNRFDLFNATFPFYQVAGLEMDLPKSLNCLQPENAFGNNPMLFSHTSDSNLYPYSPSEATRMLIATQSFTLAGLLRATAHIGNEPAFYQGSAFNGALPPGAAIWITGDNLFQTLMINLVPQSDQARDAPCWETSPSWQEDERVAFMHAKSKGAMDRFTWQSRLIRLLPEVYEGSICVRTCYITQGRVADTSPDPMHAYFATEKKGNMIVRLSERKAAWRDAHAIFDRTNKAHKPAVFSYVAKLTIQGVVAPRQWEVQVAGIANDQAKILLWRHDRMSVPVKLLNRQRIATLLQEMMRWADNVDWKMGGKKFDGMARTLRNKTKEVVRYYLAPGNHEPAPEDVSKLTDSLDPMGLYWARMESHFYTLLNNLNDALQEETIQQRDTSVRYAASMWAKAIGDEAFNAFRQSVVRGLGNSVRAIQAVARVHTYFNINIDDFISEDFSLGDENEEEEGLEI